jgi:hypothetical protein
MHPSLTALVAFCDGEARNSRIRRIAGHLSKCEPCRNQVRLIRSEKGELSAGATTPAMDSGRGLAGVLSAVAEWRNNPAEAPASELKRRLRRQIETYFGSQAVPVVERPGMRAEELLGKAGEMLDVFLGPVAADSVRDDVLGGLDSTRREAFL